MPSAPAQPRPVAPFALADLAGSEGQFSAASGRPQPDAAAPARSALRDVLKAPQVQLLDVALSKKAPEVDHWTRRHVLAASTRTPRNASEESVATITALATGRVDHDTVGAAERWYDGCKGLADWLRRHGETEAAIGAAALGSVVHAGINADDFLSDAPVKKLFKIDPALRNPQSRKLVVKMLQKLLDAGHAVCLGKATSSLPPRMRLLLVERDKPNGETKPRIVQSPGALNKATPDTCVVYEAHAAFLRLLRRLVRDVSPETVVFLAQVDIAAMYYAFVLHPDTAKFFTFFWDGKVYQMLKMVMGWRASCKLAQDFLAVPLAEALTTQAILCAHYIDNVAMAGLDEVLLNAEVEAVREILLQYGLSCPADADHLVRAATEMVFLGVLYNGVNRTMQLLPERRTELLRRLAEWLSAPSVERDVMESTLGRLQLARATTAYWTGPYLQPLHNLVAVAKRHGWRRVRLPARARRLISHLMAVIERWDGSRRWFRAEQPVVTVHTDGSLFGAGFYSCGSSPEADSRICSVQYAPHKSLAWHDRKAADRNVADDVPLCGQATSELLTILLALLCVDAPKGSTVRIVSDASAALSALASFSTSSECFRPVLERVAMLTAENDWDLDLVWVPGIFNSAPDVASRPSRHRWSRRASTSALESETRDLAAWPLKGESAYNTRRDKHRKLRKRLRTTVLYGSVLRPRNVDALVKLERERLALADSERAEQPALLTRTFAFASRTGRRDEHARANLESLLTPAADYSAACRSLLNSARFWRGRLGLPERG